MIYFVPYLMFYHYYYYLLKYFDMQYMIINVKVSLYYSLFPVMVKVFRIFLISYLWDSCPRRTNPIFRYYI